MKFVLKNPLEDGGCKIAAIEYDDEFDEDQNDELE